MKFVGAFCDIHLLGFMIPINVKYNLSFLKEMRMTNLSLRVSYDRVSTSCRSTMRL